MKLIDCRTTTTGSDENQKEMKERNEDLLEAHESCNGWSEYLEWLKLNYWQVIIEEENSLWLEKGEENNLKLKKGLEL